MSSLQKHSYKALPAQLSQGNSSKAHSEINGNIKQGAAPLEDWAYVFGRTVADSLLQCDTKDWPRLKKKIMDIFFEHKEQKSSSNSYYQTSPPCSNQQQQIFANLLRNIYTSSAHQQQYTLDMMPCTDQSSKYTAFSPGNTSTYSNDSYKNLFLLLLKLGIEIKKF